MKRLELIGLESIGEVAGDDAVGGLIGRACGREGVALSDDDVVVIAQKIVSKVEGQLVDLAQVRPSPRAQELARQLDKDAALVEVILNESRGIIRTGARALVVETHHGFICANA